MAQYEYTLTHAKLKWSLTTFVISTYVPLTPGAHITVYYPAIPVYFGSVPQSTPLILTMAFANLYPSAADPEALFLITTLLIILSLPVRYPLHH